MGYKKILVAVLATLPSLAHADQNETMNLVRALYESIWVDKYTELTPKNIWTDSNISNDFLFFVKLIFCLAMQI